LAWEAPPVRASLQPGDIFAKIFSRRGLHLNAYNAYQSILRGGHTFLTVRTGPEKVTKMGDRVGFEEISPKPVSG
jgi:hypothetical protein